MTRSQVTALLLPVWPDWPWLQQAIITRDCLPGRPVLSVSTAVIALDPLQGKISTSKSLRVYLWKTFNSKPETTWGSSHDTLMLMSPPVWAEHDLGKCWAKFPAPCAGDTVLPVSPVPRLSSSGPGPSR